MRYLYVFFVLVLFVSVGCRPYMTVVRKSDLQYLPDPNHSGEELKEKGKCFKTEIAERRKMIPARLYKIRPAKLKRVRKRLSDSLIVKYEKMDDDAIISLVVRDAYDQYVFLDEPKSDGWGGTNYYHSDDQYFLCYVGPNPLEYRFKKGDLAKNDYYYYKDKLVRPAQLKVKKVTHKPKRIKPNQYFVKAGRWDEVRQYLTPSSCFSVSRRKVEQALVDRGYVRILVDGKIDRRERQAVYDFQRKQGLKVGKLCPDTLRRLGLIKY